MEYGSYRNIERIIMPSPTMPTIPQGPEAPHQPTNQWRDNMKNYVVYAILVLIGVILLVTYVLPPRDQTDKISFTQAAQDIRDKKVKIATPVNDSTVRLLYKNGQEKTTRKEPETAFSAQLKDYGVNPNDTQIDPKGDSAATIWTNALITILPFIFVGAIFFLILRQSRNASGSLFSFGKSRAKLFTQDRPKTKFMDVAGVDEAKQELEEVIEFLKTPEKFQKLGAKIPKGVLLVGPPGTGKTLLARAIAGEAGTPFLSIAGSEFMEMLVGVGASRVRDLFETAKKASPAIIFIDEIDAIGRQRGAGLGGGHDEREQTLNQILVEMDGFEPTTNVIIIASTNRPDVLDPALLRPGRFDRRVIIDLPDLEGRKAIISIHMRNKPIAKNVDTTKLARRTVGFSGADLESMLNEAAIAAARKDAKEITALDLEEAATKVKMGPEKRRLQTEDDKKMTAYHEAGHAIVASFMPETDPVHRITIVSRGMALGYNLILPTIDRYNETKTRLFSMIAYAMGGRAAEELVYGEQTTGASNDFEKATQIARDMVTRYGMSDIGPINLEKSEEMVFLGRDMGERTSYSEETNRKVDHEVKKILDAAYAKAGQLLSEQRQKLDEVTEKLMEQETIESEEFEAMMRA
jgi:cell division protease FtsH